MQVDSQDDDDDSSLGKLLPVCLFVAISGMSGRNPIGNYKDIFFGAKLLIVQPSRTAPKGSTVFRCYNDHVKFGNLRYFVQNASPWYYSSN